MGISKSGATVLSVETNKDEAKLMKCLNFFGVKKKINQWKWVLNFEAYEELCTESRPGVSEH